MLQIKNLSKTYKGNNKPAVNNISISIRPGEIFGLLGLNGAGKTTTFKCITGLVEYENGQIEVCGHNQKDNDIFVKQNLAYIPDNHAVFEELTGLEYVNFMADVYKVDENLRRDRTNELARILNMQQNIVRPIKAYSHGMKQKIAIMGGIIHMPPLWILDEPLVGLDPVSLNEITNFMKNYVVNKDRSILFSSHSMHLVSRLCDRVAIINNGEIIGVYEGKEIDDIEELFLSVVRT